MIRNTRGEMTIAGTVSLGFVTAATIAEESELETYDPENPFEPIALTSAILAANGFTCNDGRYWILKSSPRIGWDGVTHDLIIGYADTGKAIDYVHQMQHIIRELTDRPEIANSFKIV